MYKLRRNIKVVLLSTLTLLLAGCKQGEIFYSSPKFEERLDCPMELIGDTLEISSVYDLYIYKNLLVAVAKDDISDTWLQIYSMVSGKLLASAIKTGRGPCETVMGALYPSMDQERGRLYLDDLSQNRRVVCDIDKLVQGDMDAIYDDYLPYGGWAQRHFPIHDGKSLTINNVSPAATVNLTDSQRLIVRDSLGTILCRNDSYPFEDNSYFRWNLLLRSPAEVSPNGKDLAIVTYYGAILETFAIRENSIERISTSYFLDPKIGNETQINSDTAVIGFGDVCSTNDRIYATYCNNKALTTNPLSLYTQLAVFDWNGKPKQLLSCGIRMERICVDFLGDTLYAVISDQKGALRLAKMPLPK